MLRLICPFVVRNCIKQVLSWHGSNVFMSPQETSSVTMPWWRTWRRQREPPRRSKWRLPRLRKLKSRSTWLVNTTDLQLLEPHCSTSSWMISIRSTQCTSSHWRWVFNWAGAWQDQINDPCGQQRLRSAWALFRVFAVHMRKPWVLGYPYSAQWRLWSDWAESQADPSIGHFVGFVVRRPINVKFQEQNTLLKLCS